MIDKREELIQRLDKARAVLHDLLADIPPETEIYPGWTLRQFYAHLTGWDDVGRGFSARSRAGTDPGDAGRSRCGCLQCRIRSNAQHAGLRPHRARVASGARRSESRSARIAAGEAGRTDCVCLGTYRQRREDDWGLCLARRRRTRRGADVRGTRLTTPLNCTIADLLTYALTSSMFA